MNYPSAYMAAGPVALLGLLACALPMAADASGRLSRVSTPVEPADVIARAPAAAPHEATPWTYLGPEPATISRLAVSPQNPGTVLASLDLQSEIPYSWSLFRSDDAGLEWRADATFATAVNDVLIGPEGRQLVAAFDRLYESTDDGASWTTHLNPYGLAVPILARMVQRRDGSGDLWGLHSTAEDEDIFRIEQPGFGWWHPVTPDIGAGFKLQALAVSDDQPATAAVAALNPNTGVARAWVSTDDGASWTEHSQGLPASRVTDLRFHDGRLLLSMAASDHAAPTGLYALDDPAMGWQQLFGSDTAATSVNRIEADAGNPDLLWITTEHQGLHRSDDGGQSWALSVGDSAGLGTGAIAFDEASGRLWLGVTGEGLRLSIDDGDSFTPRSTRLNAAPVVSVASNPLDFSDMALGIGSFGATVMTSTDGGLGWRNEEHPFARIPARTRYDSQGRLYATLGEYYAQTLRRREPDGDWLDVGFHFAADERGEVTDMQFGATDDTLLLSGVMYGFAADKIYPALWRSGNGGGEWELVQRGEDVYFLAYDQLQRLETAQGVVLVALEQIQNLFSGHPSRLISSTDDGLTWAPLGAGLPPDVRRVQLCSHGNQTLSLAGSSNGQRRLWRSFDAGANWAATDWQGSPELSVLDVYSALHCDADTDRLVLGNRSGDVLVSSDGGNSFQPFDSGLESQFGPVTDFHETPAGLYMGTVGGLWFNAGNGPPAAAPDTLQVRSTTSRMRHRVTLEWNQGASQVDIRRNGALIDTVANTGVWSLMQLGGATADGWQVCNAGTSECSESVPGI